MGADRYRFREELVEGLITSRPNRFIMNVMLDGNDHRCHCPTTGRIGDISFRNVPCLVEKSNDPQRSTWGTVEAFSLDPPEKPDKSWVGIDQGRANDFVSFFIGSDQMRKLLGPVKTVKREVKIGDSRIDFLINGDTLVEVKTPLHMLRVKGYPDHVSTEGFTSFERTMRHFTEISEHISEGKRGIVLLCFIFDALRFQPPNASGKLSEEMQKAVGRAIDKGVENWQVNLRLDRTGVELLNYFKLGLFHGGDR
ncbi:MAG TPA: DNA/RNA nuclease SfsA [Methanomassiliicoccales archaeon]